MTPFKKIVRIAFLIAAMTLLFAGIGQARGIRAGNGTLEQVDAVRGVIEVHGTKIRLGQRSVLRDGYRRLDFAELERFTGEAVTYTVYGAGGRLVLRDLRVGVDDE